jgi:N-methylhydantoinase A
VPDATWAVGIDVGGTFTDAVAVRTDGLARTAKVPSTPDDPARGLLDAMAALALAGVPPGAVTRVVHGTTVATNALLTGSLARVVLCATDGFRDILAIRDGQRPAMYDLFQPRPRELVAPRDRHVVKERVAGDGTILEPLAAAEIDRLVQALRRRRPAAVAVSLLFSFIEPAHERAIAEALRRELPGIPVVISSDIAREFREYPRTATTVIAAGLGPLVGRYVEGAAAGVATLGVPGSLLLMESAGGLVAADRAAREPHRLLLSGPAGGVGGAIEIGRRLGLSDLVTLDMGGTSVDVCLVRDGRAPKRTTQVHDGVPVLAPALDIATAGAGGGSIAWLDPAGALRVGPRSSGADPGPAAYGRGGTEPTITDALLISGGLDESTQLAGSVQLERSAAERAVSTVAGPLGLSVEETARGILAVATAHIAGAIRRVSIERGVDPRGLPLISYGGAGPLLAAALMRDLGLAEVVVPLTPGLLSAAGLVGADLRLDESQTLLVRFGGHDEDRLLA